MDAHASLLLAWELLHYRLIDDLYEDWLARITELVSTTGAPPCRPFRCLALHSAQEARIMRCLHHLLPKKAPWLQGAQPQGETLRVRRLRSKKGSAKRPLMPKKVLACSQRRRAKIASLHLHAKTPRCSKRRRAAIPRSKPSTSKRHRWPQQAAVASPPSYAASHG